jgi:hypothetical protein
MATNTMMYPRWSQTAEAWKQIVSIHISLSLPPRS